jgi:CRP-like cAMP-binding protein
VKIESTLTAVQRTLFLMEAEQFQQVSSEEVAAIAAKMVEMRFDGGDVVYQEGDPEGRMYVVLDGEFEHVREGVVVRRVTRGMSFGLFGLMGIADIEMVRATSPGHVIALSREDFIEAVSDSPTFAVGMIRGLAHTIRAFAGRIEGLERRLASLEGAASAAVNEPGDDGEPSRS